MHYREKRGLDTPDCSFYRHSALSYNASTDLLYPYKSHTKSYLSWDPSSFYRASCKRRSGNAPFCSAHLGRHDRRTFYLYNMCKTDAKFTYGSLECPIYKALVRKGGLVSILNKVHRNEGGELCRHVLEVPLSLGTSWLSPLYSIFCKPDNSNLDVA